MSDNCLNCDKRKFGCHDSCSTYARMKQEQQKIKDNYRQYMDGRGYDGCLASKSGRSKRYDQSRFSY